MGSGKGKEGQGEGRVNLWTYHRQHRSGQFRAPGDCFWNFRDVGKFCRNRNSAGTGYSVDRGRDGQVVVPGGEGKPGGSTEKVPGNFSGWKILRFIASLKIPIIP